MPVFSTQAATIIMLTAFPAGAAPNLPVATDPVVYESVVCDSTCDVGTDAEWAQIAREAPSSDDIRAIAKYLNETGQAAI